MSVIKGIDVSRWQGNINWQQVKNSGIRFAILKASDRSNRPEEKFNTNYNGCMAAGLPVGAYHYVYARDTVRAAQEANSLVSILKGKNISCGVWLDMEDSSLLSLSRNALSEIIYTEADILKRSGYKTGIYCNKNWYDNILDSRNLKKDFYFWIARYPYNDTGIFNENSSLNPENYAVMWQYSSRGRVPGIYTYTDLDAAFENLEIIMKPDNDSDTIRTTQSRLIHIGFSCGPYGADGIYGPDTQNAVRSFQTIYGLTPDGIAGPATQKKLEQIYREVPDYKTGSSYTVVASDLIVRKSPDGIPVGYAGLTEDARKNDKDRDGALDQGTRITCLGTEPKNGTVWMKIPSGYIAAFSKGNLYVK